MVVTYLGTRKYDFINDNNERIAGITLFYGYPTEGVEGIFPSKCTLKPNMALPAEIKVGDKLEADFTPQGKMISIRKA